MDSNFQYASTVRWHRATDLPLPPTVKRRSAGRPPPMATQHGITVPVAPTVLKTTVAAFAQPSLPIESQKSDQTPALNLHSLTPPPVRTPPAVSSLEAFRTPASVPPSRLRLPGIRKPLTIPDLPTLAPERGAATQTGPSAQRENSSRNAGQNRACDRPRAQEGLRLASGN